MDTAQALQAAISIGLAIFLITRVTLTLARRNVARGESTRLARARTLARRSSRRVDLGATPRSYDSGVERWRTRMDGMQSETSPGLTRP